MAVLAFGHACISSKNIRVLPGIRGLNPIADKFRRMVLASRFPSKACFADGICSKFISIKCSYWLCAKSRMLVVLPTWRAPFTSIALLFRCFFQKRNWLTIFRSSI